VQKASGTGSQPPCGSPAPMLSERPGSCSSPVGRRESAWKRQMEAAARVLASDPAAAPKPSPPQADLLPAENEAPGSGRRQIPRKWRMPIHRTISVAMIAAARSGWRASTRSGRRSRESPCRVVVIQAGSPLSEAGRRHSACCAPLNIPSSGRGAEALRVSVPPVVGSCANSYAIGRTAPPPSASHTNRDRPPHHPHPERRWGHPRAGT